MPSSRESGVYRLVGASAIPNLRTSKGADRNNKRLYLEKVSSKLRQCSCAAVEKGVLEPLQFDSTLCTSMRRIA